MSPIFFLAPARSFSTVISTMVGQHPQLYGLPEVHLFCAETVGKLLDGLFRIRPLFAHGLLRSVAQLGIGGQTAADVEAARQWLEANRDAATPDIFADLAAWAAPRVLVDKSPIYPYSEGALERIRATYPDARFIHLLRHPRGVMESMEKAKQEYGHQMPGGRRQGHGGITSRFAQDKNISGTDTLWYYPHSRILSFLETVPAAQQMRICGEEFMADPRPHLERLTAWLGIDQSPAAIEAMLHPEQSPYASQGPDNAPLGNDPNFLKSPDLKPYTIKPLSLEGELPGLDGETFSEATKTLARQLGYR